MSFIGGRIAPGYFNNFQLSIVKTFLGKVAESLWRQYGADISSLKLLVPNARSRMFFADELSKVIDRPLWQPQYVSIDDMMFELAGAAPADRIRAVVELYKVYSQYHREDFDSFYFWGEMLMADFDQIDKYMVDAGTLFSNINDLKELEDALVYMEEGQREVVRRFWASFGIEEEHSAEKRDFLTVWNTLSKIYDGFRERLASSGTAYTGMAHRMAAEKIKAGGALPAQEGVRYAVIGFNALSECEKTLFDHLQKSGQADFFWDYDEYYLADKEQEAGLFMRANTARYQQAEYFVNATDNFGGAKKVTAVSVPSDPLQCKYAAEFLREVYACQGSVGKETAIVLTDESLLVPLLNSIPDEVADINVTMGYPLRQTLAYSFTERLLSLQNHARTSNGATEFHHADATGLLTHPFVVAEDAARAAELNDNIVTKSRVYAPESLFAGKGIISRIFTAPESWSDITGYIINIVSEIAQGIGDKASREYFGVIADTLRKLGNSLTDCGVELTVPVVSSLARRMLQNVRIPYSGEPLSGLQVMGILETRNLDFDNVMIMSMNDDNFPGNPAASSSFIPHNLRLAYGLPTPRHHDGVYAYYFYRLLQRASRVDMVYCSSNDTDNSGEPSRYIYQLDYESPHDVIKRQAGLDIAFAGAEPITVAKSDDVAAELEKFFGGLRSLSPSAFNAYMDCRLRFYFRYIAGLKPEDVVSEEVDMPMFGTILHRAMELLYAPMLHVEDPRPQIRALIGSSAVGAAVDKAVAEICFQDESVAPGSYGGQLMMVRDIVIRYIDGGLLPFDAGGDRFTVMALEKDMEGQFTFGPDGGRRTVRLRGKADRVDMLDGGMVRIVDYKTGKPYTDFKGIGDMFGNPSYENHAMMQTFLYSLMATDMQSRGALPGRGSLPALYYVRAMNKGDYSCIIRDKGRKALVISYEDYREEMEELLGQVLTEMFSPEAPFDQCDDPGTCGGCDFNPVCRRA